MMFVSFYASGAAILLVFLSLYRLASKADLSSFVLSLPGFLFVGSMTVLTLSGLRITRTFRRSSPYERKHLAMALGMNLLALVLAAGSAELLVRFLSIDTNAGTTFAGTLLYPRSWSDVVSRTKATLKSTSRQNPFYKHDPVLGWTVVPNRLSANGMYASSAEGLRSPQVGMSFIDSGSRLSGRADGPATVRIALVGDSMTFGDEIRCEESWGHLLEQELGTEVQVLNFAVSGYGVSQVFLRYQRDVRAWRPQIVIMGVTSEAINRMMSVYNFLIYPAETGQVYARPRLDFQRGTWIPINQPLPTSEELISHPALKDLPYLRQDRYYHRFEWERDNAWDILHKSYLFRLLTSLWPPIDPVRDEVSDEALAALSRSVLRAFVQNVERDGAVPLVVHFPYQHQLRSAAADRTFVPLGVQILRNAGVNFHDATPCLIDAKSFDDFKPKGHYGAYANAAIGKCLGEIVRKDILRLRHS